MSIFKSKVIAVVVFLAIVVSKGFASEGQPAVDPIAQDIQAGVKALEYPDEVGQDFVKLVKDWKCVGWKQKLSQAKQDLEAKKITADQAAQVEEEVAKELFEQIRKEIAIADDPAEYFDLAKVLQGKKANSVGYAQMFSILSKSLGLSIEFLYALEPATDSDFSSRHVNCGVDLSDGKVMAVDSACDSLSKPFMLKEECTEDGIYWRTKDKNLLGIHRRIQLWDANGLLAVIHNFRGAEEANVKKYAEALDHFAKAVALNPKYAKAYVNRGIVYAQLGEHAAALADTAKALELDPNSAEAYCCRGRVNFAANKPTAALSDFNKAIELNPKCSFAYSYRASFYGQTGKYPEALSDSTRAIELDPKSVEAYCCRGRANFSANKLTAALSDFNKAIELKPKCSFVYSYRASFYGQTGKYAEALADSTRAIELDPKSAQAYYGRGLINLHKGDYTEALPDFDKAIEIDPKFPDAYWGRSSVYY